VAKAIDPPPSALPLLPPVTCTCAAYKLFAEMCLVCTGLARGRAKAPARARRGMTLCKTEVMATSVGYLPLCSPLLFSFSSALLRVKLEGKAWVGRIRSCDGYILAWRAITCKGGPTFSANAGRCHERRVNNSIQLSSNTCMTKRRRQ